MSPVVYRVRKNFSLLLFGAFFLFALFNPIFKKYDYGAGFPLVLVFCVLLLILVFKEWREKREKAFAEKVFLLIFAIFIVLSFVFSQTKNLGLSEVLAFLSVAGFYLVFAHQEIEWKDRFLKLVGVGALLAVILGFILYIWRDHPRMMGPFFNTLYHAHVWPNAFALFILLSWPVFLILKSPVIGKFWRSMAMALLLAGLLLTFSRGAFLAFSGQVVLIFLYYSRRLSFEHVFFIFLAGFIGVGLFFGANYLRDLNHDVIDLEEKVSFSNSEGLTSRQERVDFWTGAIDLVKERPWFGWGPFSFRQAYNPIQKTFLGNADHPHNVFLKIAAENGVIALTGFIGFLLTGFFTVLRRFKTLSRQKRDLVFVLCVAVAGALAHNMIDYNFNFFVNLLLLFTFMTFARSAVVKNPSKSGPFLGSMLALLVALTAFYEGTFLVLAETRDQSILQYSYFPRNYYLNRADFAIEEGNFSEALPYLNRELELNPLDSKAWYLSGVIYCSNDRKDKCEDSFRKAIELNPLNDFAYYRDYFRVIEGDDKTKLFLDAVLPLINNYFIYVENNVHFTAYTDNVEAAAELTDMILPYLSGEDADALKTGKAKMLETASELRKNKTF